MTSRTARSTADGTREDAAVGGQVPSDSSRSGLTLHSDELSDLAVVFQCDWPACLAAGGSRGQGHVDTGWVIIPVENVGRNGFHEILIHDMAGADAPYVALAELASLHLVWPAAVLSSMGRYQLDLEHLRHDCKTRYQHAQSGLCTFCGKFIQLDMGRHVASFIWSWLSSGGARCTIWRGTQQDCIDHMRSAHAVPVTVKASNLARWFPPWTVSRDRWCAAMSSTVYGVATDALLFSRTGVLLVHRYHVFSRVGTHVTFRGTYMARLATRSLWARELIWFVLPCALSGLGLQVGLYPGSGVGGSSGGPADGPLLVRSISRYCCSG